MCGGGPAHFPALLEPVLAAPIWNLFPPVAAYHLIQVENATLMSFAAVPIYLLARRLDLGSGYALACAAFAVAIPELAFAGAILSDPVGYPLALTALYAGVVALETCSRRAELAFIALAGLATLARVQYVILVPAFVLAAVILDRRSFARRHRLPLVLFTLVAAVAVALGPGKILGFYSVVLHLHVGWSLVRWLGLTLFLLTLAGGVVLIPGAVVGLCSGRGRREVAFSALVLPFSIGVLFEAALYAANGGDRFKERYAFVILALVPVAFGVYLKRGRPARLVVTALAAVIAVLVALLPLSAYAIETKLDDSPFLWAVAELEAQIGVGDGSLVFALAATVAAVLAAAVAWTRLRWAPVAVSLLLLAALSVAASRFDIEYSQAVRAQLVAPDPAWVDADGPGAGVGDRDPTGATGADRAALLEPVDRARAPAGSGRASDRRVREPTSRRRPRRDVARRRPLPADGDPLRRLLRHARVHGRRPGRPVQVILPLAPHGNAAAPAARAGALHNGWLATKGTLEVWPGSATDGTVTFTLSLPGRHFAAATLRFGPWTYHVEPGGDVVVRFALTGPGPSTIPFRLLAGGNVVDDSLPASVRSTIPHFAAAARPDPPAETAATGSARSSAARVTSPTAP